MNTPREHPILLVGTANPHKLGEIRKILAPLPLRIEGVEALPGPITVEEAGRTFEGNARLKALAFAGAAAALPLPRRPRWVLSDDSGLAVEALGGAPGVHSARYAEGPRSDEANNRKLLAALAGVPPARRDAAFVCALACAEVPEGPGEPRVAVEARGECRGMIAESPRGSGGFGYDPLFYLPGKGRTYAELSEEEKNRLSHRGRALALLLTRLGPLLGGRGA